jgi:hypothetical protein
MPMAADAIFGRLDLDPLEGATRSVRYESDNASQRAGRASGRCRTGGGLLGGKDPAGRFQISSPLAAVAALKLPPP